MTPLRWWVAAGAFLALGCSGDGDASSDGTAGSGGTAGNGAAGTAGAAGTGGAPVGANPYPEPGAWGPVSGPGGPAVEYETTDLFEVCAFLDGGPEDESQHHNLVVMYDGYLLMPWAPESGQGGLTFYEFSDPCNPVEHGRGFSPTMRETHSVGFSDIGGRWAVVDSLEARETQGMGGIQFWDISDLGAPRAVADLNYDSFFYPDAYARVVLSVFWQGRYVYAGAGDTGVLIVDAQDPTNPVLVDTLTFDPTLRAGQVQVVGNLLIVTAASVGRTALFDISDPTSPQPIPGGEYTPIPPTYYFTNFANGFVYYTRNDIVGGLHVYDIDDPSNPQKAGEILAPTGAGAYVFVKDNFAFTGQSDFFTIYDITDHASMTEVARFTYLDGDMDTVTPIGNVAVMALDDGASRARGEIGSAVTPWTTEVDAGAPRITWSWPRGGATGLPVTSRIGVSASEFIEPRSGWEGSVRLYETGTLPGDTRVDGWINVQEVIVNFTPKEPLKAGTEYTFEIPAGGLTDLNGNAIDEPFEITFTTN